MTTVSLISGGNRDRAIGALERAAIAAETGNPDRPIVLVATVDLDALAPGDIRAHLDRVVMGRYPEAGLDGTINLGYA